MGVYHRNGHFNTENDDKHSPRGCFYMAATANRPKSYLQNEIYQQVLQGGAPPVMLVGL